MHGQYRQQTKTHTTFVFTSGSANYISHQEFIFYSSGPYSFLFMMRFQTYTCFCNTYFKPFSVVLCEACCVPITSFFHFFNNIFQYFVAREHAAKIIYLCTVCTCSKFVSSVYALFYDFLCQSYLLLQKNTS